MLRFMLTAATALTLVAGSVAPAAAAPCWDAKGHFAKCPPKVVAPNHCRDAKGRFAKCGTPGAKPA